MSPPTLWPLPATVLETGNDFNLADCVSRAEIDTQDPEVDVSDISDVDETDNEQNNLLEGCYFNPNQLQGSSSTCYGATLGTKRQLKAKERRKQKVRENRRVEREKKRETRGTSEKGVVLKHKARLHASGDRI